MFLNAWQKATGHKIWISEEAVDAMSADELDQIEIDHDTKPEPFPGQVLYHDRKPVDQGDDPAETPAPSPADEPGTALDADQLVDQGDDASLDATEPADGFVSDTPQ